MKNLFLWAVLLSGIFPLSAQNELFIRSGASLHIVGQNDALEAVDNAAPVLYVKGDIQNAGEFVNVGGEFQLTGNFAQNGTFTSTGDDVFVGQNDQNVSGSLNDENARFFNLLLDKVPESEGSCLHNIRVASTIKFVGGGVLNTGNNYARVDNPAPVTAVQGYDDLGSNDKFIQGELRRGINNGGSTQSYIFPVSWSHTATGNEAQGTQYAIVTVANVSPESASSDGNSMLSVRFFRDSGQAAGLGLTDCEVPVDSRINHGIWEVADTDPDDEVDDYDLELRAENVADTYGAVDYTIVKSADGATNWNFGTSTDDCDGVPSVPASVSRTGFSEFSFFQIAGTNAVLPAELTYFSAELSADNRVGLEWETAAERNTSHFVVQRSTGEPDFREINRTQAAGESNTPQKYTFIDRTAEKNTEYYYRLKTVDRDGAFAYSQVEKVFIEATNPFGDLYPNPAFEKANLDFYGERRETVTFSMHNLVGQLVREFTIETTVGPRTLTFDMTGILPGIYFLECSIGGRKFRQEIVVAR